MNPPPILRFPDDLPPTGIYDAVLFDFDGTLVDTAPNHYRAWMAAVQELTGYRFDFSVRDFNEKFAGRSSEQLADAFGLLTGHDPAYLLIAAHAMKKSFKDGWHEIKPVMDFALNVSGAGAKVAIVSNGDIEGIVHVLNYTRLVEIQSLFILGSGDHRGLAMHRPKPAPDSFLLAAVQLRTDPSRCIVIEDSPIGLEAAARAGMRAYKVTHPAELPVSLEPLSHS